MAGSTPEERVRVAVVHQAWGDVTFLHWRADAEAVAARIPKALEPDLVDGSAWVTITPFRVERFRVVGVPPVPFRTSFCETNVRTYVRNRDGLDGLWFLSLDVSDVLNVVGGRLAAVPYFLATMSVDRADGGRVRYRSERRTGPPAGHDIVVEPGERLPPDSVDDTTARLTGRWRAFTRFGGVILTIPVQHEPWPLRRASVVDLDETLVAAARVRVVPGEPVVQFADGVDATLGPPRPA